MNEIYKVVDDKVKQVRQRKKGKKTDTVEKEEMKM